MDAKEPPHRLRRAIQENNIYLVRRLLQHADPRSADPGPNRYTSLAWAATCCHEDIYDLLLESGHDDEELSRDAEQNTILMLLAALPLPHLNVNHVPSTRYEQPEGAALRMARAYYDRFPFLIDWQNKQGKTALHIAALNGNNEFVEMLCDLGADLDLTDEQGNTPLHYASAWGHTRIVELLINRGCKFNTKNNEGFTASDYAYSNQMMETLQDTARLMFENKKRNRRYNTPGSASRSIDSRREYDTERGSPETTLSGRHLNRLRSGSGTTSASDSTTDYDHGVGSHLAPGLRNQPSLSSSNSSPAPSSHSQLTPSLHSTLPSHNTLAPPQRNRSLSSNGTGTPPPPPQKPPLPPKDQPPSQKIGPPPQTPKLRSSASLSPIMSQKYLQQATRSPNASTLLPPSTTDLSISPVASRMRQRDADAMAQYLSSSSKLATPATGTSNVSGTGSGEPPKSASSISSPVDKISSKLLPPRIGGMLRGSASAAALRTPTSSSTSPTPPANGGGGSGSSTPMTASRSMSGTAAVPAVDGLPRYRSTTLDGLEKIQQGQPSGPTLASTPAPAPPPTVSSSSGKGMNSVGSKILGLGLREKKSVPKERDKDGSANTNPSKALEYGLSGMNPPRRV